MRVGVGVGAVMMGGCDAVAEAKARVLGEDATEVSASAEVAATPTEAVVAATPIAPEPLLLNREGVAGVVEEVRTKAAAGRPAPAPVPPVEDLGRPRSEPSRAFVPYDSGSVGSIATAPAPAPAPERATVSPTPRPRPRPKVSRPVEPEREWVCGPCGRG